jgi:hypothetical protein
LSVKAKKFEGSNVLDFDLASGKDGFLATNSLLATAVLVIRASCEHHGNWTLPATFEELVPRAVRNTLERSGDFFGRETVLVLHGNETRAAALDVESKMTEAALGRVLVSDIRNFGHGRHHWLAKRGHESAVLAFDTVSDRLLMDRTLTLLPTDVPVMRIPVPGRGPVAALSGIASVFYIVDRYGRVRGIDPGRPGVPNFGRKLYNLNAFERRRAVSDDSRKAISVRRKLDAFDSRCVDQSIRDQFERGYDNHLKALSKVIFRSLILDYDGTICDRASRFGPAPHLIALKLSSLIKGGMTIGIATGRGSSVRESLRASISKGLWHSVIVGYYNCAEIARLDQDEVPQTSRTAGPDLESVARLLVTDPILHKLCHVEPRRHQVTVTSREGELSEAALWKLVNDCVLRERLPGVAVVSSSHSIDVVPERRSKLNLLQHLPKDTSSEEVLCVGDRGRWPGNDWDLLNHRWSLSVDKVSTAIDRGWNVAPAGLRGMGALAFYLAHLRKRRHGYSLDLRSN